MAIEIINDPQWSGEWKQAVDENGEYVATIRYIHGTGKWLVLDELEQYSPSALHEALRKRAEMLKAHRATN